jgi:sulfur carrier protein ThiS
VPQSRQTLETLEATQASSCTRQGGVRLSGSSLPRANKEGKQFTFQSAIACMAFCGGTLAVSLNGELVPFTTHRAQIPRFIALDS